MALWHQSALGGEKVRIVTINPKGANARGNALKSE